MPGCRYFYKPMFSLVGRYLMIVQMGFQREMDWSVTHPIHEQQQGKQSHPASPKKGLASLNLPFSLLYHRTGFKTMNVRNLTTRPALSCQTREAQKPSILKPARAPLTRYLGDLRVGSVGWKPHGYLRKHRYAMEGQSRNAECNSIAYSDVLTTFCMHSLKWNTRHQNQVSERLCRAKAANWADLTKSA